MERTDHPEIAETPEVVAEPEGDSDDSLIRWMLSLTPAQRLEVLQGYVDSVQALRDGART